MVDLIPVESNPLFAAVSPTDPYLYPYLYVTNFISGTVSVIEAGGHTVVRNPMMFDSPFGVAVTTTGDYVYVTLPFSNKVSVIETTTNTVVTAIPVGNWPAGVAVAPRRAYVANFGSNEVWVIDTKTHGVVTAITVAEPGFVAVAPVGGRAYVTSPLGNVSVIDTTINQVIGNPIQVGGIPYGVAVTPNGDQVYVADLDRDEVVVIETATNAVSRIGVGPGPIAVAADPNGQHAFVSNNAEIKQSQPLANTVSVIDINSNAVVDTVPPLGNGPAGLVATARNLYVVYAGSDFVAVIDL